MSIVVLNGGSTLANFTQADVDLTAIEIVNDTSPQLGGDLDVNGSSIINSNNGASITFKVDDASGTQHTAVNIATDDHTDTSDVTQYLSYIQSTQRGLKIGRNTQQFSTTGNTPDNGEGDYEINGVIIEPTGNTWPLMQLYSYGEAAGRNPVYDRYYPNGPQNFSNAAVVLGGANGTVSSPSALGNGKRLGQLGFIAHDGNNFGGSNSLSSCALTAQMIEDAADDNDRAAELLFEFMPEGGDGTAGSRNTVLKVREDSVTIQPTDNGTIGKFSRSLIELRPNDIQNVEIRDGEFKVFASDIIFDNLPTSDPTNAGQLWNDSGTLKISAG